MAIDKPNSWRLSTPGHTGWTRTARPKDSKKYFMVTADTHVNEPIDLWTSRMPKKLHQRLPRIITDTDGVKTQVAEGYRPHKLRELKLEGEDLERSKRGDADPDHRLNDHQRDGIDAEIMFPQKGMAMWATPDPVFAQAQCRAYNDWAWEVFGPHYDRLSPLPGIATGDVAGSVEEIYRVAKTGFRGIMLPVKPTWGPHDPLEHPNYNMSMFDPIWDAIQETSLAITFHISTGRDPRGARGEGGAVINYVCHSLAPTVEPVVNLCASGILERYPGLKFATIEAGIGWVPWVLTAMDEAYHKHHMWTFPKLKMLPSEYFRAHGFASFQEDQPGIDLARTYNLTKNFMWANDYPHQEGAWPHSAEAVERQMGNLTEEERADILGLNAARLFKFKVPERYHKT
ncbi:amidohydrolase [Dehalococcoidia bacterium]|nr:amidohydrolase [Dehalococcoidia bacterium]